MTDTDMKQLSPSARNWSGWFKPNARQRRRKPIPATLIVDSFAGGPLQGVRSLTSMPRMMIYEAGNYEITLSIDCHVAQPKHVISIMGQTMFRMPDTNVGTVAEAQIELLRGDKVAGTTKSDEFGGFDLGGISEGIYDMRIQLNAEELHIPELPALVCSQGA